MTHSRPVFAAVQTANDAFKLRYPRYLKISVLAALVLTILLVWLWPDIPARPYRLRERVEIVLIEVPDPVVIPPPEPVAPPRIPPVIEAAPLGDPCTEIFDLEFPGFWDQPQAPVTSPPDDSGFTASSTPPRLVHQPRADYPEIARRSGLEGTVIVNVLVGVEGRVDQAVVASSAHPLLDRAAVAAALRCRFTPALQREMKVKVWVAVPYRFRLN
jgi:protein TonB